MEAYNYMNSEKNSKKIKYIKNIYAKTIKLLKKIKRKAKLNYLEKKHIKDPIKIL